MRDGCLAPRRTDACRLPAFERSRDPDRPFYGTGKSRGGQPRAGRLDQQEATVRLAHMRNPAEGSAAPSLRERTGVYAWYVLGVLFLVYVLNFIDRNILSILAQDIKADLRL